MKRIPLKTLLIAAVSVATVVFIVLYVRDAVNKTRATADSVNIYFSPHSGNMNISGGETILTVQAQESNQRISGFDLTLDSLDHLAFVDVEAPTFPGKEPGAIQVAQIKKEVGLYRTRLTYVFQNADADLPSIIQLKVLFRGTAPASGGITFSNTQVTGSASNISFNVVGTNARYTFLFPSPTPQPPTITPSPTPVPPTAIPTVAPTSAAPTVRPTASVTISVPTSVPPTAIATISVPTITPPQCQFKYKGDADCNNVIDLADFEIWRKEFTGEVAGRRADFNNSFIVDLVDYETWRKGFFGEI